MLFVGQRNTPDAMEVGADLVCRFVGCFVEVDCFGAARLGIDRKLIQSLQARAPGDSLMKHDMPYFLRIRRHRKGFKAGSGVNVKESRHSIAIYVRVIEKEDGLGERTRGETAITRRRRECGRSRGVNWTEGAISDDHDGRYYRTKHIMFPPQALFLS
jgi:hypothetical protein